MGTAAEVRDQEPLIAVALVAAIVENLLAEGERDTVDQLVRHFVGLWNTPYDLLSKVLYFDFCDELEALSDFAIAEGTHDYVVNQLLKKGQPKLMLAKAVSLMVLLHDKGWDFPAVALALAVEDCHKVPKGGGS